MPDWAGEIEFYREFVDAAIARGGNVLEIACGTGRVTIRLARAGASVVGLDLSSDMLDVAREKSAGIPGLRWEQGDMRSFDLGETFDLIVIPAHSLQNLLTTEDHVATFECIRRHLRPNGTLIVHVDHLSVKWLGELCGEKGGVYEPAEQFTHPESGREVQASRAWWYEPATQTAIANTVWEEFGEDGEIISRQETGQVRFHCFFRYEMEHLLARAGFIVDALYGDFDRSELRADNTEMIWVARARAGE